MPWIDAIDVARRTPPTRKEWAQVVEYRRRKAKPKFYTDENFPTLAIQVLRGTKALVLSSKEAGLDGHPDENHVSFALKNGYIFLTCYRDFLDEKRFPLVHCPAIVVFDLGSGSTLREMRTAFQCLRTMYGSPQFFDKWVKIDAKRDSLTEYWRFLDGTTSRTRYRVHQGILQEWVDD
jgi:hypothetical protein